MPQFKTARWSRLIVGQSEVQSGVWVQVEHGVGNGRHVAPARIVATPWINAPVLIADSRRNGIQNDGSRWLVETSRLRTPYTTLKAIL